MDDLERVLTWLDQTDRLALAHLAINVETRTKTDGTPVTVADTGIETILRSRIGEAFPGDAIVGEEEGGSLPASGTAWILDPIDGTKNYARGIGVFATLVARWRDGVTDLAVVSAPALGHRWWADATGAYLDGDPIGVSSAASLEGADLCTGGLQAQWIDDATRPGVDRILGRVRRHRGFGDFWGHVLVAQGSMDAMLDLAPLALWDIAAPRFIVERAGGRVTGLDGSPGLQPGPVLTSNGQVHDELLALLGSR